MAKAIDKTVVEAARQSLVEVLQSFLLSSVFTTSARFDLPRPTEYTSVRFFTNPPGDPNYDLSQTPSFFVNY